MSSFTRVSSVYSLIPSLPYLCVGFIGVIYLSWAKSLICIAWLGFAKLDSIRAWFYYCFCIPLLVVEKMFSGYWRRDSIWREIKERSSKTFSVKCLEVCSVYHHEFWDAECQSLCSYWWFGISRTLIATVSLCLEKRRLGARCVLSLGCNFALV